MVESISMLVPVDRMTRRISDFSVTVPGKNSSTMLPSYTSSALPHHLDRNWYYIAPGWLAVCGQGDAVEDFGDQVEKALGEDDGPQLA